MKTNRGFTFYIEDNGDKHVSANGCHWVKLGAHIDATQLINSIEQWKKEAHQDSNWMWAPPGFIVNNKSLEKTLKEIGVTK